MCRGNGLGEEVGYMCTSEIRDSQLASRSVLKDLTDDTVIISAAFSSKIGQHADINNVKWIKGQGKWQVAAIWHHPKEGKSRCLGTHFLQRRRTISDLSFLFLSSFARGLVSVWCFVVSPYNFHYDCQPMQCSPPPCFSPCSPNICPSIM